MRLSIIAIACAIAASAVTASPTPIAKRDAASHHKVLNFVLSVEHLEAELFKQGLQKYNANAFKKAGFDQRVYDRFVQMGAQDKTHVATLKTAIKHIGGTPYAPCTYKFPLRTVYDFITIAGAVKNSAVSVYLGAVPDLSGDILTVAASKMTVEARHSAFLNEALGQSSSPYPFDTPLSAKQVVTIAAPLIEHCPYDIGIEPFKQLQAALPPKGQYKVKTAFEDEDPNQTTWCQFLYNNKVVVSPRRECALPETATGFIYMVITDTATPIAFKDDSHILAGPALLFQEEY
ncbi:hypothetical protein BGZ51_003780 [Haplosporangium sp. Z 767]|nr:hypothetical protein BGZ51_003780 [Haplosporangium sp. Z 767]KAF9193778.1 hypothetical protein BGZ50_007071 [Haplosporangium sp. Z 11]